MPHRRLETSMNRPAIHQSRQVLEILSTYRCEFQSHSASGLGEEHNSGGPDRAFLDKKVKLERHSRGKRFLCRDKQPSQAQLSHS